MSITVNDLHDSAPAEDAPSWEDQRRSQQFRHDIRQSLTAVMSLAAIVEKSLDRGPEVLKRLDQIRSETEWMSRLVSSACPRAKDIQVLDVGDVVAEAWCSAAATSTCSIQLVREARAGASVDRDDLTRSVRNLLDNAVRAAGKDGTVVVEVRTEPEEVLIVVRDSGPGFGFIPTQQGIGLTTVRRFADEHAGRLEVSRSLLGGAELTLRLPGTPLRTSGGGVRCGS